MDLQELKPLPSEWISADGRAAGQSGRRAAWPRLGEWRSSGHPVDGSAWVVEEEVGLCSYLCSAGFVALLRLGWFPVWCGTGEVGRKKIEIIEFLKQNSYFS